MRSSTGAPNQPVVSLHTAGPIIRRAIGDVTGISPEHVPTSGVENAGGADAQDVHSRADVPHAGLAAGTARDEDALLLASMHHEALHLGVLIGVTSSIFNSCNLTHVLTPELGVRFMPPDPTLARCHAVALCSRAARGRIGEAVHALVTIIGQARKVTRSLVAKDAERRDEASLRECTGLWRCAAGAAADFVQEFVDGEFFLPAGPGERNGDKLVELLRRAQNGGSPCLENGGPQLPEWAERRRRRRIALNQNAMLTASGRTSLIRVVDLSASGMGLAGVPALAIGTIVRIRMSTQRCFIGEVVWCSDARAGIQFSRELPATDPLLAGE